MGQKDSDLDSQESPGQRETEGFDTAEDRIRLIADSIPALISYIDSDYRYRFVNKSYTDWFGWSASDVIGKTMADVLGEEAFEKLRPHVDSALLGNRHSFESEIPYKDGGTRFIRASYTPDVSGDGTVKGIFVLVADITEQKATEGALIKSEERYRAFIAHSTEGIWRFELDEPIPTHLPVDEQVRLAYERGYLAECNEAMAKQYGFESADVLTGARLGDLLVQSDPKNYEFLAAFIRSGYHLADAESHERDANGEDRYFLNNFVGIVENGFLIRAWGIQRDVTSAKHADDATARLAAIVVSSDDAIISKDLSGIITSWNVGAVKMFGYMPEEIIGKPITTLIPPERVNEASEILRRIRREENVEHYETVRRRRDGTDIFVSLTVSPIRNSEGNVIGASKIVRDITERKRIEEAIHQNQAMLTLAMQSSRMGVWELDLATNTVSWSEELEEIFGLDKGGFGGTEEHFFQLVHEDDREEAWREIRAAITEHRPYSIEFRFHHADGSIRWMEGRGEAVYSQKGEPVRLYGVGIDITERKNAESALRESEQRFARFMQHLPGLAWIKDTEGRYVYANDSAERSFGVSGPKLYGRTDEEIFPPETAAQFREHDQRALDSGTGIQIAESLVEEDGILHHSIVSKFPIPGADGRPSLIGGMAIDVTDQKQAEEALRQRMDFDEAVMRNMGEGLYTVDSQGRVTFMNPAAEKLFGWTFDELRGRKMHDVTHYKHRDGSPFPAEECAGLQVLKRNISLVDHEDVFIRRDGTFFDVLYSSSPIRQGENVAGLVVVFTDITERKLAEQRLALQAAIGDLIRTITNPSDLLYTVSAAVSHSLRTKRALFNEIDLINDRETVHRDYCADGVKSVAGVHAVSEYSPVTTREMQEGKTVINVDSSIDPRTADYYKTSYEPNGERSYVAVPLLRNGVWVASLWVSDDEPRDWSKEDVALLETIAERTWSAVEKIRIDAALRESQETFSKAFNSGPLVFTLSSLKDGRLVEVNDTFIEVTGYSREEAIGKTSLELGLWGNEMDRDGEMSTVSQTGQVRNVEYTFRTRNGEEIVGLLSAERIEIGGEPFALTVIQDITDRKKADLRIRESEERYRNLANAMPQLVWTTDADGNVDYYNSLASDIYGIKFDQQLGRWNWQAGLHPDDLERTQTAWIASQDTGVYEVEHRILVRDGSYRWHLSKASAVRDETTGEILKWFGTATDIHDYKSAQQALVKAERKAAEEYEALLGRIVPLAATLGRARHLSSIYRALRDFISASMPCSGFFVSFYEQETSLRRAAYVWGEGEEVDISELPPMKLHPEGGANSRAVFEKRTIITNDYWEDMKKRPHVVLRHNGRDPMSSLIVPMMIKDTVLGTLEVQAHENGAYKREHSVALEMAANLAAVAIENVRLIVTEASMREAAEAANRAKDEFLSVLSHELRTPLNAMLGWVRMLKAGVLDEENSARALEVIERNTRLQGNLIEDLLDVSRIISGKMRIETELVDLVSVVNTVSETVRPLAEAKGVSYRFACEDDAVFLTADTVRLQQVVSNLLQNSIKFTPSGGEVEVTIERVGTDAILRVKDTGVGIEAELLPHIFDRFRQADASARRNFTGLGLGLTIVRNIVELHDGEIEVFSDGKDKGALFVVTLPLAADFYGIAKGTGEETILASGSLAGKSILLVDDDAENLTPIKIFLENERAEVTSAFTGKEALRYLSERDFHVMITDIGMPEMDGYELVAKLREDEAGRNASLKTIALTAYASVDDRQRALESGFNAHLAKPVNFDELLATIEKIAHNGR